MLLDLLICLDVQWLCSMLFVLWKSVLVVCAKQGCETGKRVHVLLASSVGELLPASIGVGTGYFCPEGPSMVVVLWVVGLRKVSCDVRPVDIQHNVCMKSILVVVTAGHLHATSASLELLHITKELEGL